MSVLALEPDATQADAIRHVVCNLVGARLTVAISIGQALHLLRTSTPDLILLPALVSPSQETALIEALRALPDASHVDTLITPVLPSSADGVIAAPQGWRRWTSRRTQTTQATSVEASTFAESLRWALERARERKAHAVPADRHKAAAGHAVEAVVEAASQAPEAPVALLEVPQLPPALLDVSPVLVEPTLIEAVSLSLDVAVAPAEAPGALLQLLDDSHNPLVPNLQDLELQDATNRLLKKLSQSSASDRRQHRRFAASELPGLRSARIKSGPHVAVVDVSAGGVLLESDARLQPDSEAILELVGRAGQTVVPFRVVRCHVAGLNGAPRYLGACAFKEPLDLDELAWADARGGKVPTLTLVPSRVAARNSW
jgi:hypothetical protein